jgi:hypothetical protein
VANLRISARALIAVGSGANVGGISPGSGGVLFPLSAGCTEVAYKRKPRRKAGIPAW